MRLVIKLQPAVLLSVYNSAKLAGCIGPLNAKASTVQLIKF